MIKFPFKSFITEHLGILKRPFGTVRVISEHNSIKAEFLIDSGADISIIPHQMGEKGLGFSISKGEKIINLGGAGGGLIPVVFRDIEMKFKKETIKTKIAWAMVDTVPLILGRLDIFVKFNIEFKESENSIILQKVEEG